jgi:hypothetical protein
VTLAFALGNGAKGKLPPQAIALNSASWDPTANVLTITGSDLTTLTNNIMSVIQNQFGARQGTPAPPASFTLSAKVTDANNPTGFSLIGSLPVSLVQVPAP